MKLRTEADVVAALAGTVTLEDMYAACEAAGVHLRDNGTDVVHGRSDTRWKRRVRNALQALKAAGAASRVGPATWALNGRSERPRRLLLVLCGEPGAIELAVRDAADLLRETDAPWDLVVADPPWQLDRGSAEAAYRRTYQRDAEKVVGGYVDVPSDQSYVEFTERWVRAAAASLKHGGYLAAISGPQQAAHIQVTCEAAGLTYVNTVVVHRPFALRTTRRFAFAHTVLTIVCAGPVDNPRRYFTPPSDLPRARSGRAYPLDWWPDVPKMERPGLMRNDNALHPKLVRRIVRALTPGPESGGDPWSALVADPFVGSGTTAIVCWEEQRRFVGGDVNPEAVRFSAARLLAEHVWPRLEAPTLFDDDPVGPVAASTALAGARKAMT